MHSSGDDHLPGDTSSKNEYTRGDSLKSLSHHDSLSETDRGNQLKTMKGKEQDDSPPLPPPSPGSSNGSPSTGSRGGEVLHSSQAVIQMPSELHQSYLPPDSTELLVTNVGGADANAQAASGSKSVTEKKSNIISLGEIEISPDNVPAAPLMRPREKKQTGQQIKKILRIKKQAPKVHKERQVFFNNPEKNATFGYATNSISTTKYTVLTFLPKNLFEQFRRAANFYFLVIALIQLVPGLSSISAYSSIVPLVIVLAVTAVKEAYEDWGRFVSDTETNNFPCNVLRGTEFTTLEWAKVNVGDIIKVYNGDRLPADVMLLNTSENQGLCYVETSNLDGETNLKLHQANLDTLCIGDGTGMAAFEGAYVECEGPNNRLYNFNGFLMMGGAKKPLGVKQLLLRGCVLKNTHWVIGLIIYTGPESKLMQNATSPPSKRTTLEKKTNHLLAYIFGFMCFICAVGAIGSGVWTAIRQDETWYVPPQYNPGVTGLINFFSFLIAFSVMIPISLYVSMEMVKVAQALFIGADLEMYYPDNDTPAKARTSNLSEELGQVEYIFSDKTGTLTRNVMEFFKCTIGGVAYGNGLTEIAIARAKREETVLPQVDTTPLPGVDPKFAFNDARLLDDLKKPGPQRDKIIEFFSLLSICHTVIPERDTKDESRIIYQAASPDEATLVDAAKQLGFFFHTRNPKDIICNILGEDIQFQILNILEFNSTRKRMSVISRDRTTGSIRLYSKGADTVIFERLKPGQEEFKAQTLDHLEEFASDGLRTLCLAWRDIPEADYDEWNKVFEEASVSIQDRDRKLMEAAELIEKDLILIGATAIEDKLQVGVPDAIYTLAQAEIKIWVLTGDHQETAINIGFACSLLTSTMTILIVNARSPEETERQLIAAIQQSEEEGEYGLVIDGATLQHALDPARNMRLLQIAQRCAAVICCRVSPLQKAQVVTLVKDNLKVITLAIGDGANDVGMIQQAHIGIGISGQEGMQAVMNSDYAIAQFRFLTRLLLIHGRSDYKRLAKLILYSFYKNMVFSLCQFPFDWFNGFSAQTMYDSWSMTIFNIVFTGLPIILYAIFDQDVTPKMIYRYPQMYETGQRNLEFNTRLLLYWLGTGVYQAFMVFFSVFLIFKGSLITLDGRSQDMYVFGAFCYFAVIVVVNVRLAIESRYWTGFTWFFIIACVLIWIPWLLIESSVYTFITDSIMYGIAYRLFQSGVFWISLPFIVALCNVPVVAIEYLRRQLRPQNYQIVQELKRLARLERERRAKNQAIELAGGSTNIFKARKAIRKSMRHNETETKFTGFAFSPDDDGQETLAHQFKRQNTSDRGALPRNLRPDPNYNNGSSSNNNTTAEKGSSSSSGPNNLPFPYSK